MQHVGYREIEEMGEGAGHHVLWEGKYITQGCTASAPPRLLGPGRKYAIVPTWFAPDVLGCRAWNFRPVPRLPDARPCTWQAPPRWFRRCLELSEPSDPFRGQQQGHARGAAKKHK